MSFKDKIDEASLLLQLREGDGKAFEILYNNYAPKIYTNILRLVKSTVIAEEILQDVFQESWKRRDNIDLTKSYRYYLVTIARNLVFDYFKSESRKRDLYTYLAQQSTELSHSLEEMLNYKETDSIFKEAIAALSPQRQRIFTLCKLEGKSYEEVGVLLNISPSTISDHIVKATKFIKNYYIRQQVFLILVACLPH